MTNDEKIERMARALGIHGPFRKGAKAALAALAALETPAAKPPLNIRFVSHMPRPTYPEGTYPPGELARADVAIDAKTYKVVKHKYDKEGRLATPEEISIAWSHFADPPTPAKELPEGVTWRGDIRFSDWRADLLGIPLIAIKREDGVTVAIHPYCSVGLVVTEEYILNKIKEDMDA